MHLCLKFLSMNLNNFMKQKILILIILIISSTSVFAETPIEILSRLGFSIVNNDPIDFKLPDVSNEKEVSLSSFKGKWIFLVFWATWCGPCKYEMPTLESLHQELGNNNLEIIGVSIDNDSSDLVKKFLNNYGITFLNLHDRNNKVAYKYRANSVPSIYVISPDWKLAAIFRGAKSWESKVVFSSIRKLTKFDKIGNLPSVPNTTSQSDQIQLPNNLTPPIVRLKLNNRNTIRPNEDINFEVSVSWIGDARQYIFKTPKLTVPENVILGNVFSESSSEVDGAVLRYIFPLKFKKEGDYTIGPIELSYAPRKGGEALFSRDRGLEVKVIQYTYKKYWLVFLSTLIMTTLIGLFVFYKIKKQKIKNKIEEKVKINIAKVNTRFKEILLQKVTLNNKEYSIKLLTFFKEISDDKLEIEKVKKIMDEIGYGGLIVTQEKLIFYEKIIKKIINYNIELEE